MLVMGSGLLALCSPRSLSWDTILKAAAFLVPTGAPAGSPETTNHQEGGVLSVKEIHPLQTWECPASNQGVGKIRLLKWSSYTQDCKLQTRGFYN